MQIKILLMMIPFIFLFSGCTPKVITKIEYREPPKYNFQKIDLTGVKIKIDDYKNLSAKEVREICTPSLIKLQDIYKPSKEFYDNQIDEYKKGK